MFRLSFGELHNACNPIESVHCELRPGFFLTQFKKTKKKMKHEAVKLRALHSWDKG